MINIIFPFLLTDSKIYHILIAAEGGKKNAGNQQYENVRNSKRTDADITYGGCGD